MRRSIPEIPHAHGRVGASFSQTANTLRLPSEARSSIDRANEDFLSFGEEMKQRVMSSPGYPSPSSPTDRGLSILYSQAWIPLFRAWALFYQSSKNWGLNIWQVRVSEFESYRRQLSEVRASAERLGLHPIRATSPVVPAPSDRGTPPAPARPITTSTAPSWPGPDRRPSPALPSQEEASVLPYIAAGIGGVAIITLLLVRHS